MTASHPSIFELRHFAVTGELDSFDSAHVNTCDGCSKRLQQLAQNELRARNVRLAADTGVVAHPGLRSAMPAFLAVAATMLVLLVARPVAASNEPAFGYSSSDLVAVEPEGVHGIRTEHVRAGQAGPLVDGGARFAD